jgi:hypothetical protein
VELRRMDEQVGARALVLSSERTELGRLRQADALVAAEGNGTKPDRKKEND